jgi:hypothetical protein
MNEVVYDEMLGAVDDAIALAEDAVKVAQSMRPVQAPPITLVKVAKDRCNEVATSLIKSGSFPGQTVDDIAKTLENGGAATYLDLLEKVASRAVFPLDIFGDLGGELVEKSSSSYQRHDTSPHGKAELWARCWDEAEAECAG